MAELDRVFDLIDLDWHRFGRLAYRLRSIKGITAYLGHPQVRNFLRHRYYDAEHRNREEGRLRDAMLVHRAFGPCFDDDHAALRWATDAYWGTAVKAAPYVRPNNATVLRDVAQEVLPERAAEFIEQLLGLGVVPARERRPATTRLSFRMETSVTDRSLAVLENLKKAKGYKTMDDAWAHLMRLGEKEVKRAERRSASK